MNYYPMQTHNPPKSVIEPVAQKAYEVYAHVYGEQAAMMDLAKGCRGGFSVSEYIAFLYASSFPKHEWSKRIDEALLRER